jgi:hypothetical protein
MVRIVWHECIDAPTGLSRIIGSLRAIYNGHLVMLRSFVCPPRSWFPSRSCHLPVYMCVFSLNHPCGSCSDSSTRASWMGW